MADTQVLRVERSQVTVPRGRYLLDLFTNPAVSVAVAGQPAYTTYEHYERVRSQPGASKPVLLLTSFTTPSIPDGEFSRGLDVVVIPTIPFSKSGVGLASLQALLGASVFNQNPLIVPYVDYALEIYFAPPPPVFEGFKLEKTIAYLGYVAPPDVPFVPPYVMVPTLIGLDLAAAEQALLDAGLLVGTVTFVKHSAPFNQVILQGSIPNTLIAVGSSISFTVSLGRPVGRNEHIVPKDMQMYISNSITPDTTN